MVYSKNAFLTKDEQTVNATYILNYLLGYGWTKQAVCGMLGNMETESTINPGIWQGLSSGNMSGGFGIVQWTPATKYIDWANARNLPYQEMDSNLQRILYEVENGIQYYSSSRTFKEFTQSTDTAYNLAMDFLAHYERPADPSQPARGDQANYWYTTLTGEPIPPSGGGGTPPIEGGGGTPKNKTKDIIHLLLSDTLNGWKW